MKDVYDILAQVRKTSAKTGKVAILQKNADNDELREYLRVCYEPRINFYQSKVDKKAVTKQGPHFFSRHTVNDVIIALHQRNVTGGDAKQWLANYWNGLGEGWEREMLEMLIDRDVRAGFSVSTINKVWPDLVTDVPYMRCSLPKASKIKDFDWKSGVYSQIKADGMFANVNREKDGSVTIMSRNGSPFPIESFPEIAKFMKRIEKGTQLHGELLVARARFSGNEILPRSEGNGMLNRLLKGGDLDAGCIVLYHCWDIIPIANAVANGSYKVPYKYRYETLLEAFNDQHDDCVSLIETAVVHSRQEAKDHYKQALARGLEGTVVKEGSAIWEDKTSKYQVKFKLEVTVELKVVGWKAGKNKFAGMVGSLECESQDGKLSVNVSGFDDDLRREMTDNFDRDWIDSIVAVTSNSILPERNGTWCLFLPRLAEQRLDKKKADTLAQIQAQFDAALDEF